MTVQTARLLVAAAVLSSACAATVDPETSAELGGGKADGFHESCELSDLDEFDFGAPNETADEPTWLAPVTDRDNALELSASLYPEGDVDWYAMRVEDTPLGELTPYLHWGESDFGEAAVKICIFFELDELPYWYYRPLDCGGGYGEIADYTLPDGTPAPEPLRGCCTLVSPGAYYQPLTYEVDRSGPSDSGTIYFRVEGLPQFDGYCGAYTLLYGF